jgi:hypothetical protein
MALVDAELARLRAGGPAPLRALAGSGPIEREARDGIVLATRIHAEDDHLMVLVDARAGRRMLATGGFAMGPDGVARTPH